MAGRRNMPVSKGKDPSMPKMGPAHPGDARKASVPSGARSESDRGKVGRDIGPAPKRKSRHDGAAGSGSCKPFRPKGGNTSGPLKY